MIFINVTRRKYSSIIFVNSGRSPSSLIAKSRKHRPVACVSGPVNETPAGSGEHNRVRESENGQNQSTRENGYKTARVTVWREILFR
ncbi:hypothetical protein KCP71_24045 [Salmonella enterica subsp. enterica]|nr:hypothetical protein KCP71_24045 [Salmonella enterica subsp. enterica]